MNPDDEFFIIIPSNASNLRYSANKSTSFTFLLPGGYVLEGNWDVALWSIQIPSTVKPEVKLTIENGVAVPRRIPRRTMFVYTDIVADSVVGDSSVPILALVQLGDGTYTDFVPIHLNYHKVKVTQLNEISIKLMDISGGPIEFDQPEGDVVIELHFRRRTI